MLSFMDRWDEPTAYALTVTGQLEAFLLRLVMVAAEPFTHQSYYCGAFNAIELYLGHRSYSPFLVPFDWMRGRPLMVSTWNLRDVSIDGRPMTQEEWTQKCRLKVNHHLACTCSQHGDFCPVHPECICGCQRHAHWRNTDECCAGSLDCDNCPSYRPNPQESK